MALMSWGEFHFVLRRLSKCVIIPPPHTHCWPPPHGLQGEGVGLDYDKLVCAGVSDSSWAFVSPKTRLSFQSNKSQSMLAKIKGTGLRHEEIWLFIVLIINLSWVFVSVCQCLSITYYNIIVLWCNMCLMGCTFRITLSWLHLLPTWTQHNILCSSVAGHIPKRESEEREAW